MILERPEAFTVTQGGEPKQVHVDKQPLRNLLSPGEVQSGTITVLDTRPGLPLTFSWEIVEISSRGGISHEVKAVANAF